VADPVVKPGEVLLRIERIGFCGSDLSTYRGANPLVSYPRIPGHEVGATIVELGEGVGAEWRIGQQVLVSPYTACGACAACRQGRFNCCRNNETMGVQRDGAMSEFFAVPQEKLLTSATLSLSEMALVEPLTVGFHAVSRGRVTEADTVLVFGAGAIGLGAIAGAATRSARVIAVDLDDRKLELARNCGADITINGAEEDLHEKLAELTGGEGPEVTIEAVGAPQTFRSAVEEVSFAGRVVYIGYAKAPVEYETKFFVQKELDILGSRNAMPDDFAAVIQYLEAGKFPLHEVVNREVSLDEAGAALEDWHQNPGNFTKIHLQFSS
tara:strand:+ start:4744 stop:5718 length:975 start_codon:yes stop_codon:yes gene_type:complete